MTEANIPENEKERLEALASYHILDTLSEREFDEITAIASAVCETPISLISLLDEKRQWFKSRQGLSATETPRAYAFCAHAILNPTEAFEIEDARKDSRFHDNPLVIGEPYVISYTGIPLINKNGFPFGTLCVIDHQPKKLTDIQLKSLHGLANQVVQLFELRKTNRELTTLKSDLEQKNKDLEQFAYIVSHDLKSPLNNILAFSGELQEDYSKELDDYGKECINYIQEASLQLKHFIDGILSYYKGNEISLHDRETLSLHDFLSSITRLTGAGKNIIFNFSRKETLVHVNRAAIEEIFINLISNSIKYNDKKNPTITISYKESPDYYLFSVSDNGRGIVPENQQKVFELFNTLGEPDREGHRGTGIGLATVKKIVEKLGGNIQLHSELGKGTTIEFTLKK